MLSQEDKTKEKEEEHQTQTKRQTEESFFFGCFKSLQKVDDRRKEMRRNTEELVCVCSFFLGVNFFVCFVQLQINKRRKTNNSKRKKKKKKKEEKNTNVHQLVVNPCAFVFYSFE